MSKSSLQWWALINIVKTQYNSDASNIYYLFYINIYLVKLFYYYVPRACKDYEPACFRCNLVADDDPIMCVCFFDVLERPDIVLKYLLRGTKRDSTAKRCPPLKMRVAYSFDFPHL